MIQFVKNNDNYLFCHYNSYNFQFEFIKKCLTELRLESKQNYPTHVQYPTILLLLNVRFSTG